MKTNSKALFKKISEKALLIRQKSFLMCITAGKGHLGGSFSCAEILASIYYSKLFNISPKLMNNPNRDRIIFSKGHSCLALYSILADLGFFPMEKLETYGQNGSMLGGHPDHLIPGVEISTGSLGHGLSIGCGMALNAKINQRKYKTVVILGDGECNEGSIWEAAAFAAKERLTSLTVIIDDNKVAATDYTKNLLGNTLLANKWRAFGWHTIEIDGHNPQEILGVLSLKRKPSPLAIVANTIKGKGVSFMENSPKWHHGVPQGEEIETAKKELGLI